MMYIHFKVSEPMCQYIDIKSIICTKIPKYKKYQAITENVKYLYIMNIISC
jgi:hypothetical protein